MIGAIADYFNVDQGYLLGDSLLGENMPLIKMVVMN